MSGTTAIEAVGAARRSTGGCRDELLHIVSALVMLRRLARTLRFAIREEAFAPVLGAAATLISIGTISYALGEDWSVVDAFYFAVATLTTSSVADPDLVLDNGWTKLFTVFYLLLGIGILVEVLRRFAVAFVQVRAADARRENAARHRSPNAVDREDPT